VVLILGKRDLGASIGWVGGRWSRGTLREIPAVTTQGEFGGFKWPAVGHMTRRVRVLGIRPHAQVAVGLRRQ